MNKDTKTAVATELKKAQETIDKIASMLDKSQHYFDILKQSSAASKHLKSADKLILESQLRSCLKAKVTANKKSQEKLVAEVIHIVNKVS